MDEESVNLYISTLKDGKIRIRDTRIMVTGPFNVGKTALTKRLLWEKIDITKRQSTDGVDLHVQECVMDIHNGYWMVDKAYVKNMLSYEHRMARILRTRHQNAQGKNFDEDEMTKEEKEGISGQELDDEQPDDYCEKNHVISDIQENHSQQNSKDEAKRDLAQVINQLVEMKEISIEDNGELSIWDFGGQLVFYSTHQIYFTPRAIYIVVLDMRKGLYDIVENDKVYVDIHGGKNWTYKDFLVFWLNSIYTYGRGAPVLVVATHADEYEELEEKYRNDILECLRKKHKHALSIIKGVEFLDNRYDEEGSQYRKYAELRKCIFEIAQNREEKYWEQQIPASWFELEKELKETKKWIMYFKDVKELNSKLKTPLPSIDNIKLYLRFQHAIGKYIYFDESKLCEYVVLNPQHLIDAFKCIITSEEFCKKKRLDLYSSWKDFCDTALLSDELLEKLWKKDSEQFFQCSNELLMFMKRLDIIAALPRDQDDRQSTEKLLVPCMLKKRVTKDILHNFDQCFGSTSILCYKFDEFIPPAIFHRLIAACINKWHISKKDQQLLIYCGYAVFDLDKSHSHKLCITFVNHNIQLQVFRFNGSPRKKLCVQVRDFVNEKMESFLNIYNLKVIINKALYIKCLDVSLKSRKGLMSVGDIEECLEEGQILCEEHGQIHTQDPYLLLKYWFSDFRKVKSVKRKKKGRHSTGDSDEDTATCSKQSQLDNVPEDSLACLGTSNGNKVSDEGTTQFGKKRWKKFVESDFSSWTNNSKKREVKQGTPCFGPLDLAREMKLSKVFAEQQEDVGKRLQRNCESHGLEFHGVTPGNGNCFFEAISSQLSRLHLQSKSPEELRIAVTNYIRNNRNYGGMDGPISLERFVEGNFEEYCDRMSMNGEFADHVVVVGMAKMLEHDIAIVTSSPSASPAESLTWVVGKENFEGEPLLLGHIWEYHYQSLRPKDKGESENCDLHQAKILEKNMKEEVSKRVDPALEDIWRSFHISLNPYIDQQALKDYQHFNDIFEKLISNGEIMLGSYASLIKILDSCDVPSAYIVRQYQDQIFSKLPKKEKEGVERLEIRVSDTELEPEVLEGKMVNFVKGRVGSSSRRQWSTFQNYLELELPKADVKACKNFEEAFDLMVQKGLVEIGNYNFLIESLKDVDSRSQKKVQYYENIIKKKLEDQGGHY